MTRAERKAAEAAYNALMKRVRKLSAGMSRQSIRQVDAVVAEMRASIGRDVSKELLSKAKADALLRKVAAGLDRIEKQWIRSAALVTKNIIGHIVDQHQLVHLRVARVTGHQSGGIVTRLSAVPNQVTKAVASSLRDGVSVNKLIRANVRSVERGMRTYVRGAVDTVPSDAALAGMRRLLNGELPFDLGGSTRAEVRAGATLAGRIERLLKTEAIETYRHANAKAMNASPVELVAHWDLSVGHSSDDECDELANADVGFGPGWYPPDEWPDAPHPNCQCGQGDVRVVGSGTEGD